MQHYERERDLEAEVAANIESLQNFYGLSSVNSLRQLVEIILDPKKSEQLHKEKGTTFAAIFTRDNQQYALQPAHIDIFATKYSFEKLVEKFPKPRGQTNRMLSAILEKKFSHEVITSHQTRKSLWLLLSGARFNMLQHRGLYDQLLTYQDYPDYFSRAIQQDITRTVRRAESADGDLKSLLNILTAFSRRNPYVGYCQGLNFVAHFLLTMEFTDEQAFWLLSSIIQTIIPMDYYTNMIGVVCDQQLFLAVLSNTHPQITAKFDQIGLDPSVLSIEWFVCLFTSSLPMYLSKIVWDRLLVQGPRAFIKTGVIIMGYFKEKILQVQQFHQVILLLERGTKTLKITEQEFNLSFEHIFISREGLVIARTLYRQYHVKQKLSERLNTKKLNEEEIKCDPQWPICVLALEKARRSREEAEVWIYRQQKPPRLDYQYLIREDKKPIKLTPLYDKNKKKGAPKQEAFKKEKIDVTFNAHEDVADIETVRASNYSTFQPKSTEKSKHLLVKNEDSQQNRALLIGRICHVCEGNLNNKAEKRRQMRSVVLLSEVQSNQQLKRSNILQIMQGGQQADLQRSQTILFFSQFVNDNFELSNIIVPSTKRM